MQSFDASSGLVYRESTSASVRSMIPTWTTNFRGRRVDPSKHRSALGCDTLQEMALRTCIWNIDNIEPEALQWLGWSYAGRLYNHIKSTDTLNFRTWNIFQKAFPEDIDRHSAYRVQDSSGGSLPSVIDRLAKLDVRTLTFLSIRISDITIDQLIALNKIETLAVLALEVGRSPHNETMSIQMIRDWGRSVGESGALKNLRVLVIDDYMNLQRSLVLKSIAFFPGLKLVGIYSLHPPEAEDCGEDWSLHSAPELDSKWGSAGITKNSAMQQLYDASFEASQDAITSDHTTYRSLSIHYTQGDKNRRADDLTWFIRKAKDDRLPKRVGEHKGPIHGKKRRVRDDKKVDMGSLLGGFA